MYTNGNSWLNSLYLRNFALYLNSQLIDDKQLTRTLKLFRHDYRPVLQILTALYVSLQGLHGHTNPRPTPSYTRWKTITDMVTLKMTWAAISMPHTATTTMVQPLAQVMISTLQIMHDTIITLVFIALRILVPIVIIISGPEVHPSVQMSWKFTMKCLLKSIPRKARSIVHFRIPHNTFPQLPTPLPPPKKFFQLQIDVNFRLRCHCL